MNLSLQYHSCVIRCACRCGQVWRTATTRRCCRLCLLRPVGRRRRPAVTVVRLADCVDDWPSSRTCRPARRWTSARRRPTGGESSTRSSQRDRSSRYAYCETRSVHWLPDQTLLTAVISCSSTTVIIYDDSDDDVIAAAAAAAAVVVNTLYFGLLF